MAMKRKISPILILISNRISAERFLVVGVVSSELREGRKGQLRLISEAATHRNTASIYLNIGLVSQLCTPTNRTKHSNCAISNKKTLL